MALQDDMPSLLKLLEDSPNLPVFCFHEAVLGPAHQCSLLHTHDRTPSAIPASFPLCSEVKSTKNVDPSTSNLKHFLLSSTPLRKVSSPQNLVLDSDTETGWSFSMATPTCQQQPKGVPLAITTDEESTATADTSTGEELLLGQRSIEKKPQNLSCEKIHNRVALRLGAGDKPLARALFPRQVQGTPKLRSRDVIPATPMLLERTPLPAQWLQFDPFQFSPIPISPLVCSSQHVVTPHRQAGDYSISLLGGPDSVLETPKGVPNEKIGATTVSKDFVGKEVYVSCSQELFGSPEMFSTTEQCALSRIVPVEEKETAFEGEKGACATVEADCLKDSAEFPTHYRQGEPESVSQDPLRTNAGVISQPPPHANEITTVARTPIQEAVCGTSSSGQRQDQSDILDLIFMGGHQLEVDQSLRCVHSSETAAGVGITAPVASGSKHGSVSEKEEGTQQAKTSSLLASRKLPVDVSSVVSEQPAELNSHGKTTSVLQCDTDSSEKMDDNNQVNSSKCGISHTATWQTNTEKDERYMQEPTPSGPPQRRSLDDAPESASKRVCSSLDQPPASKRRKPSSKTFLYPGSKQLTRKTKSRRTRTTQLSGTASRPCSTTVVDEINRECKASSESVSFGPLQSTGLASSTSRRRRSGVVSTTLPPAKRICRQSATKKIGVEHVPVEHPHSDSKQIELQVSDAVRNTATADQGTDGNNTEEHESNPPCKERHSCEDVNANTSHGITVKMETKTVAVPQDPTTTVNETTCADGSEVNGMRTIGTENKECSTSKISKNSEEISEEQKGKERYGNEETSAVKSPSETSHSVVERKGSVLKSPLQSVVDRKGSVLKSPSQSVVDRKGSVLKSPSQSVVDRKGSVLKSPSQSVVESKGSCEGGIVHRKRGLRAPGLRRTTRRAQQKDTVEAGGKEPEPSPQPGLDRVREIPQNVDNLSVVPCSPPTESPGLAVLHCKPSPSVARAGENTDETQGGENGGSSRQSDSEFQTAGGTAGFVGFQTAGGKAIHVTERAMERARKLISEEMEETPSSEHAQATTSLQPLKATVKPSGIHTTKTIPNFATPKADPSTSLKTPSSALPTTRNNVPSSSTSLASHHNFHTPSIATTATTATAHALTVPRGVLSAKRRPSRSFKAPRKASSVSKGEEQASVARILRNFRMGGAGSERSSAKKERDSSVKAGESAAKKQGVVSSVVESGFSTAGGRKLNISVTAMQRARDFISEDKENEISSAHTASTVQSVSPFHRGASSSSSDQFAGFTTASGKGISISAAALERAQSIVSGVEQDARSPNDRGNEPVTLGTCPAEAQGQVMVGFQTASGRSMRVSSHSLAKAEALVASVPSDSSRPPVHCDRPSDEMTGFQTAGGREISVSSRSLHSAQKLIEADPDYQSLSLQLERSVSGYKPSLLTGFQTAGGKQVSVAAQSLQRAESLLELEHVPTETHLHEKPESADSAQNTAVLALPPEADDFTDLDIDTLTAFTQVDVHHTAKGEGHVDSLSPTLCEISNIAQFENPVSDCEETHTDHSCFLSTQAVRQFLDFSSDDDNGDSMEQNVQLTYCNQASPDDSNVPSPSVTESDSKAVSKEPLSQMMRNNQTERHSSDFTTEKPCATVDASVIPFHTQTATEDVSVTPSHTQSATEDVSVTSSHAQSATEDDSVTPSHTQTATEDASVTPSHTQSAIEDALNVDNAVEAKGDDDILDELFGITCQDLGPLYSSFLPPHTDTCTDSTTDAELTTTPLNTAQLQPNESDRVCAAFTVPECGSVHQSSSCREPLFSEKEPDTSFSNEMSACVEPDTSTIASVRSPEVNANLADSPDLHNTDTTQQSTPVVQAFSTPSKDHHELQGNDSPIIQECDLMPGTTLALPNTTQADISLLNEVLSASVLDTIEASMNGSKLEDVRGSCGNEIAEPAEPTFRTQSPSPCEEVRMDKDSTRDDMQPSQQEEDKVGGSAMHDQCSAPPPTLPSTSDSQHVTTVEHGNLASDVNANVCDLPSVFPGLQTTGGKQVQVSEQALSAVRHVLNSTSDGVSLNCSAALPRSSESSGFGLQTASGKPVSVSQSALSAAKNVLDGGSDSRKSTASMSFPGLQTASGKSVEISQETLSKVRMIFDAEEVEKNDQLRIRESHFPGLQTASGHKVEISESSMQAAKRAIHGEEQTDSLHTCSTRGNTSFPGLQTASGHKVEISESSMQAAKRAIHGEEQTDSLHTCSTRGNTRFPGLQTASGHKVEISESSMQAAKRVIHAEEQTDSLHTGLTRGSTSFHGLQTASGHKVEISESSMQAARRTIHSESESGGGISGLTTAKGDRVVISEEALKAVKLKFGESGSIGAQPAQDRPTFSGLMTAGGGAVHISESSMQAARRALGSEGEGTASCPSSASPLESTAKVEKRGFSGLQTAGGQKVEISESSLQAARKAIHEEANSRETISTAEDDPQEPISTAPSHPSIVPSEPTSSQSSSSMPRYKPTFSTLPPSTLPPSAPPPTAHLPTASSSDSVSVSGGRYKPVFSASGSRRGEAGTQQQQQVASGRASTNTPITASSTTTVTGPPGLLSTPEGMLWDRATPPSHRPFIPVLTFLNHDGSYISATPRRRYPSNANAARRPQHNHGQSSRSRGQSVTGAQPPFHSTSSASRPFHPPTQGTPFRKPDSISFQQPSYGTRSGNPSLTSSASQSGPLCYSTPRQRKDTQFACTPVWKASVTRSRRRGSCSSSFTSHQISSTQHSNMAQEHHMESKAAGSSMLCEPSSQVRNPGSRRVCVSKKHSSGVAEGSRVATSIQVDNDGTSNMATSTQVDNDGSSNAALSMPLSPISISLSQLCALEEPQTAPLVAGKDDSGYYSRNHTAITAGKSPGTQHAREQQSHSHAHSKVRSRSHSPIHEIPDPEFAETAKESLNDSLEEEYPETDPIELEVLDLLAPKASSSRTCQPRPHQSITSLPLPQKSGPIKPQTGSLLAARLQNQRIPLHLAVGRRLPGRHMHKELYSQGVHPSVVAVSVSNAADFHFSGAHYFSSAVLSGAPVCVGDGAVLRLQEGGAGVGECWEAFVLSPGVDPKLISFEWFANHYKWVIWKLAALEVTFPVMFAGRCLTPDWLMLQMKYRYDREIDHAERSSIRKICERDDTPARTMVLCVSQIHTDRLREELSTSRSADGRNESASDSKCERKDDSKLEQSRTFTPPCIELTDGWYSLPAILDPPLKGMIRCGKIVIGTKLVIYGAELTGDSEACHPLEAPGNLALKISANSTRRAQWHAKLGYQQLPHPFPVSLTSLYLDGGLVGCTEVIVARVYPLLCMEKKSEGRSVFRNGRAEERVALSHEALRQRKIEKICARIEREFEEEMAKEEGGRVTRRRSRRLNSLQIKQLQDGEEIYQALTNSPDPHAFQELLSRTQCVLLESYCQTLRSQRQSELQTRIREAIDEAEDQLPPARNVVPLLRVRLVPVGPAWSVDCQLSVWRPGEEVRGVMSEGKALRVFNLSATPSRSKQQQQRLQLTASRSTRYEQVTLPAPMRTNYSPRECVDIGRLPLTRPVFGEFDTVGVVVCHTSSQLPAGESSTRQVDTVYLSNAEGRLLAIKVWDGLKAYALEDVVTPGAKLAISNLSVRGQGPAHPLASAGDRCSFSLHPREPHLRLALEELGRTLPNKMADFLHSLEEEIADLL